jgi:chemotaxis protein CheX
MQQAFQIETFREDAGRIAMDVFRTMLSLDVWPDEAAAADLPVEIATAAVYFAGEWKGAVLIECTTSQAFDFTARLFSSAPPTSMSDDVRDALGELANMVAGNLKSVLPGGVDISMPSVVEGKNYSLKVCGGNLSTRLRFQSPLGAFSLILVEVLNEA